MIHITIEKIWANQVRVNNSRPDHYLLGMRRGYIGIKMGVCITPISARRSFVLTNMTLQIGIYVKKITLILFCRYVDLPMCLPVCNPIHGENALVGPEYCFWKICISLDRIQNCFTKLLHKIAFSSLGLLLAISGHGRACTETFHFLSGFFERIQ